MGLAQVNTSSHLGQSYHVGRNNYIGFENVKVNSKNITGSGTHNSSFWLLSLKIISEMNSSDISITSGPILFWTFDTEHLFKNI